MGVKDLLCDTTKPKEYQAGWNDAVSWIYQNFTIKKGKSEIIVKLTIDEKELLKGVECKNLKLNYPKRSIRWMLLQKLKNLLKRKVKAS